MLGSEKEFYLNTAIGASRLSGCDGRQGALLIKDQKILSHGYNRKIVTKEKWEISAVYDAIFAARTESSLQDSTIFLTYFPDVNDLKLIVSVGVTSIYFLGRIKDVDAVKLLNSLKKDSIPLEIIKLGK